MKKNRNSSPPAVGGSSLLAVFAVLTLSVFAVLSLTTVQAERRISDASARAVSAYYAADRQAEEIYARLRLGENMTGVEQAENVWHFRCGISQHQYLSVAVACEDGVWEILRWQAVASPQPIEEEILPVWSGEGEELHD